jgi:sensor histidine kinase regulating citrate/malate metabolism
VAINNLIRNAEVHAFPESLQGAELNFIIRESRKKIIIDYTNNGKPFPENLAAGDFLSFGRKSMESPGEGLGGAWVGKVIEAHHGTFKIIRDENPLHFRITLPKK